MSFLLRLALGGALLFQYVSFSSGAVQAAQYRPEALVEVGERVERAVAIGVRPVVLFDLDDTLINSRDRTRRILWELSNEPAFRAEHGFAAEALSQIKLEDIRYYTDDTLKGLGINDAKVLEEVRNYWNNLFFTDEYCANDPAVQGAPGYVRWLAKKGARIVYLTGRDRPRMEVGTRVNLAKNRFPLEKQGSRLLMKPDKKLDDTEFKKTAFEYVGSLGEVVGVFENEPRNINAMHQAFPKAVAIFLDTIHSKNPDVPADEVAWVRDFRRNARESSAPIPYLTGKTYQEMSE